MSNQEYDKCKISRALIEQVLSSDEFELDKEHISLISSFIDYFGKFLNTNTKTNIYIALYEGFMNIRIYRYLHPELLFYQAPNFNYFDEATAAQLKKFYDIATSCKN